MTSIAEHKPRLNGDHPYRTTTKFQRNVDGSFARDDEGYLVPIIPPKDQRREKQESTPEEREAARMRVAAKLKEEGRAMAKLNRQVVGRTGAGITVRRGKRQDIGDPDCRLSESEDFPLLAVLRRDKAHGMIASVLAYRRLVALCEAEPLKGQSYGDGNSNGINVEYRSTLRDGVAEVDEAKRKGFKGHQVTGGEIEYRSEVKRDQGAYDIPATRKLAAVAKHDGDPIVGRTESLHIKINEDTLADYIDSRPRLDRIRAALGPLLEPVEDAVLGGQTMGWIGKQDGHDGRTAEIAGKVLVYRGLTILDGFLGAPPVKTSNKYEASNDNVLVSFTKSA